jgi:large subunit ribosomal protein L30
MSGGRAQAGRAAAGSATASGAAGAAGAALTVTLEKSLHGQLRQIAASVRGLGLRRRHQSVQVSDTAQNRGMIRAASHLLRVQGAAQAPEGK